MRSNARRLVIMDQVTKVRKRLKLEQWKTIITECRASGMTVTSWCKTHGIAEQTYYRNLKKLREMEIDKLPASLMPLPDEKPVACIFYMNPQISGIVIRIFQSTIF